jgi:branched-chain amino acid transport system substrate-binding protein
MHQEGGMTTRKRGARSVLLAALLALVAAAVLASTASAQKSPIIIGWAYDGKGNMAPFDGPALAAAKIRISQINAKGGVLGRKLQLITCDTQNNNPAKSKACARSLLAKGAEIMFVTCDTDFATPVTQEAINRGKLAVAPCIGTDQMGPQRFGAKGRLAFSFGNVAQDEGSAMAEYAYKAFGPNAALATNTLLVYFKDVVAAFEARWKQLGGKVVAKETYQTGANNVGNAVSRLNAVKADVIVTSTAFGELPAFVSGLRSLGNSTPIINSWAGDGTYWVTKDPQISDYYFVTYASVFGDDPVAAVNALAKQVKAGTGGFVTGAAAIDGVAVAIRRAGGSTNGLGLAAQLEKFTKVPTLSGLVSFTPQLHSVFGRQYRVVKITANQAKVVGRITAKVVPKI